MMRRYVRPGRVHRRWRRTLPAGDDSGGGGLGMRPTRPWTGASANQPSFASRATACSIRRRSSSHDTRSRPTRYLCRMPSSCSMAFRGLTMIAPSLTMSSTRDSGSMPSFPRVSAGSVICPLLETFANRVSSPPAESIAPVLRLGTQGLNRTNVPTQHWLEPTGSTFCADLIRNQEERGVRAAK